MELIVLDDNKKELYQFDFGKFQYDSKITKLTDLPEIDERSKILLNKLDYGASVYSYIDELDDFYLSFLNDVILKDNLFNFNYFIGASLLDEFSSFDKNGILVDVIKEIYNKNQTKKFIFDFYNDNLLTNQFSLKIFKVDDYVYILTKDTTEFVFLSKEENNIFDNAAIPVVVIQDYTFVKCNKQYLNRLGFKSSDEVIGKQIGYSGLFGSSKGNSFKKIYDKIVSGKITSYSFPYDLEIKNKHYYLNINTNYILYKGKPATLVFFNDITEQEINKMEIEKKENETSSLKDNLSNIQRISKTNMSYTDSEGNIDWSNFSFDVFKLNFKYNDNFQGNLLDVILDEDVHYWYEAHNNCSPENPEETCLVRILNDEDEIVYIRTYIICNYDHEGNEIEHITFYQDVTEEQNYQNQLEIALKDKEILLTEVHHRVKNNLQIILSLINLNRSYKKDPEIILNDTETRIYAMALIHEKIYGSTSLSDVNMYDYVESLVSSLLDNFLSDIEFHNNVELIDLNMEQAIPLGLIINELVTNTIKHAFSDNKKGNLYIKFKKEDKHYTLIVEDDGKGLPDDFDIDNLSSLGLIVVQNLTLQMGGTLNLINSNGTKIKIEFDDE